MNGFSKSFTIFPVMALLTGCSAIQERWDGLTPRQRSVATFVGAVLVVGAIKAHEFDNGDSAPMTGPPAPSIPTPGVDCTTYPAACR